MIPILAFDTSDCKIECGGGYVGLLVAQLISTIVGRWVGLLAADLGNFSLFPGELHAYVHTMPEYDTILFIKSLCPLDRFLDAFHPPWRTVRDLAHRNKRQTRMPKSDRVTSEHAPFSLRVHTLHSDGRDGQLSFSVPLLQQLHTFSIPDLPNFLEFVELQGTILTETH